MRTLEEELEELAPTPDPGFVADMERRMQLGFPPRKPRRFAHPTIALPKFRHPVFAGAAASALLALAVSLAIVNDDGGPPVAGPEQPLAGGVASDDVAAREAEGSVSGEALSAERARPTIALPPQPEPPAGDVAPGRRDRKVEQSAQLTLAAATDDFDGVSNSIFTIVDRRKGFVVSSSFTQSEDGASGGFFDLRVPGGQLQATLNELSRIATVRARTEAGTDVTGTFVAARDRLRIARAERESLLGRLENATTARAAEAIRQRLEIVAGQITGARSELRGLRERTDYAAISIELLDEDGVPGAARSETDEAFDDAVGSLEDILTFLIRALGVLVPVGLAATLGWFASARLQRRRRERALA